MSCSCCFFFTCEHLTSGPAPRADRLKTWMEQWPVLGGKPLVYDELHKSTHVTIITVNLYKAHNSINQLVFFILVYDETQTFFMIFYIHSVPRVSFLVGQVYG